MALHHPRTVSLRGNRRGQLPPRREEGEKCQEQEVLGREGSGHPGVRERETEIRFGFLGSESKGQGPGGRPAGLHGGSEGCERGVRAV